MHFLYLCNVTTFKKCTTTYFFIPVLIVRHADCVSGIICCCKQAPGIKAIHSKNKIKSNMCNRGVYRP
uniref:Uncharacterized protein n=1 Tax=Anguilla anguilla TaxID=7936 RepID=A0A0E9WRN4_ANGAN